MILVPGILGSILSSPDGTEMWPPTPSEVVFGYGRKDELLREDLRVGDIVRSVSCFDIYEPLIETLGTMGFKESGGGDRLHVFPYDWRRDLEQIADRLAARIEEVAASATSVAIVAHSMGGLVARLVLESGKFSAKPWFAKIAALMTLGTPHLGAPLALARVLGLDGDMGISPEDFRVIAGDRRYPSGYQLLPAPAEAACWDIKAGGTLGILDIYDPAVAGALGLDGALLARAKWVHATLAAGQAPAHIRYFYFAGTGHKTATRLNIGASSRQVTRTDDAGDGTVPLWSALPVSGQKQLVVGEHTKFFNETNFKAVFFRLFGKDFPKPPIDLAAAGATLSVQALTLRRDEDVELLILPSSPVGTIRGEIILERTAGPAEPFGKVGDGVAVAYSGPPTPMLKVHLRAIGHPGVYRARFEGQPAAAVPVMFAVTDR